MKKLTREQIDALTDGELEAVADAVAWQGPGNWHLSLNGNGVFGIMESAARRGWEVTVVCRAAFGMESIASVAFGFRQQAAVSVRHPRIVVAAFRAFLYAVNMDAPKPDADALLAEILAE